MNNALETELVNFENLDGDAARGKSGLLLAHVADLLKLTSDQCSEEQLDTYDTVLLKLAERVEVEARIELARKLAPLARAPRAVIRRLAGDQIEVAEPVLTESPVLDDIDLVYLVENQTGGHCAAIARRTVVSETVSGAIVSRGDDQALRVLAANAGASFDTSTAEKLVGWAGSDKALLALLNKRGDLPTSAIGQAVDNAARSLGDKLKADGQHDAAARLEDASELVKDRLLKRLSPGEYDFKGAMETVNMLARQGALTADVVSEYAARDDFAHAAAGVSILIGRPIGSTVALMSDSNTGPFILAAKACALGEHCVSALLACGPWRQKLTRERRARALRQYERLPATAACRIHAQWH
ncbi:MAG: DUF2336 domain-containing protein [Pseudomonadota bacterium]